MSNNRIRFDGLAELRQALRNLPKRLTDEATNIVEHTAQRMKADVTSDYPEGPTGNLKRGVVISRSHGGFATGATVKNNAKHAFIFEHGTQVRHTDLGWNRGRMPPGRVFVPAAVRNRREMFNALISMVERNGLTVTGNAI